MATDTMTFSRFLRESGEAIAAVDRGPVRLQRRDGDDLILRRADQDESEREGLRLAAGLLGRSLMGSDRRTQAELLEGTFSWMKFLPEADRLDFTDQLAELIEASNAIDRPDLITTLVAQWKNTAEIWADPALKARLDADPQPADESIPRSE